MRDGFIGVMDSGMGGVSVLKSLVREMPCENFVYWGDNKNAPYGTREADEIYSLTRAIVDKLISEGAKAIVIACNTATSAAAARLRSELEIPVFGLEPALKPAAAHPEGTIVLALATEATIKLEKYRQLLKLYGKDVISLPCPELVEFVERGVTDGEELNAYFNALFEPYRNSEISGVVLGCTHFVWLKGVISRALPHARIYDGNEGLARHVRKVLSESGNLKQTGVGSAVLNTTSDDPAVIHMMKKMYDMDF